MSILKAEDFANVVFMSDAEAKFRTEADRLHIALAALPKESQQAKEIIERLYTLQKRVDQLHRWRSNQVF